MQDWHLEFGNGVGLCGWNISDASADKLLYIFTCIRFSDVCLIKRREEGDLWLVYMFVCFYKWIIMGRLEILIPVRSLYFRTSIHLIVNILN